MGTELDLDDVCAESRLARRQLSELRAERDNFEELHAQAKEAMRDLRAEVERLTQRAQMWADEAARRSAEVERLKAQLAEANEAGTAMMAEVMRRNDERNALRAEVERLTRERAEAQEKADYQKERADSFEGTMNSAIDQAMEAQEQVAALRAEVEEKHRLNMEYANEVLGLRAEVERLTAENKAAWDSAEYNAERARKAEAEVNAKQARIDELMIEYCPEDMTRDQWEEYERHQVALKMPEALRGETG